MISESKNDQTKIREYFKSIDYPEVKLAGLVLDYPVGSVYKITFITDDSTQSTAYAVVEGDSVSGYANNFNTECDIYRLVLAQHLGERVIEGGVAVKQDGSPELISSHPPFPPPLNGNIQNPGTDRNTIDIVVSRYEQMLFKAQLETENAWQLLQVESLKRAEAEARIEEIKRLVVSGEVPQDTPRTYEESAILSASDAANETLFTDDAVAGVVEDEMISTAGNKRPQAASFDVHRRVALGKSF